MCDKDVLLSGVWLKDRVQTNLGISEKDAETIARLVRLELGRPMSGEDRNAARETAFGRLEVRGSMESRARILKSAADALERYVRETEANQETYYHTFLAGCLRRHGYSPEKTGE